MPGLMNVPTFWIVLAAAVLVAGFAIHVSTYFGRGLLEALPNLLVVHGSIFVPLIAALAICRGRWQEARDHAPGWTRSLVVIAFLYAVGNFAAVIAETNRDVRPGEQIVRGYSTPARRALADERARRQAPLQARAFSGHWMLFGSLALMILAGEQRRRRGP